jgi:hypothetical protein
MNPSDLRIWDEIDVGQPDQLGTTLRKNHSTSSNSEIWTCPESGKAQYFLEREASQVLSEDDGVRNDTDDETDRSDGKTESNSLCDDNNSFQPRIHRPSMQRQDYAMDYYDKQRKQLARLENMQKDQWPAHRQSRRIFQDDDDDDLPLMRSTFHSHTGGKVRVTTESLFGGAVHHARYPLATQVDMWRRMKRNSTYQESEEEQESQDLQSLDVSIGDVGEDEELLGEDGLPYVFEAVITEVGENETRASIEPTCMSEQAIKEGSPASFDTLLDYNNTAPPIIAADAGVIQELPTFEQVVVTYNFPEDNHEFGFVERIDEESGARTEDMLQPMNVAARLKEEEIVQEAIMYLETLAREFTVRDIEEDDAKNTDRGARIEVA